MKRIPLTQGKYALVDDQDYELVSRFNWHAAHENGRWYASCSCYMGTVGGKTRNSTMRMHRLILRPPKGSEIDHKNHRTLDNRRANLRICTHRQNARNQLAQTGKSSQYKGVHHYKKYGTWTAHIVINGKKKHLGTFYNEQEAARAYNAAAIKYFGEFAHVNTI